MSLKFTILGCGNSSGVPAAGNYWGNCNPNEPKNRRYRCSALLESDETTIIIDTNADFRVMTHEYDVSDLAAVFYTHHHSDHCHGIDDLRPFYFNNDRKKIPIYTSEQSLEEIKKRFNYLFGGGVDGELYPPMLDGHAFNDSDYGAAIKFKDIEYTPFEMDHGTCKSVGYRFGNVSYCVDMKSLDAKALDLIKGSDIWIVDGAGYDNPDNRAHADLQRLYEYNKYIGAREVYVTSLSSFMDYKQLQDQMPAGFYPAYDGLSFDIK